MFFILFGYWVPGGGGLPRDGYTTCLCSFSPWAAQKSKFSKLIFFDIVTTQYDHPRYVKHVLGRIYVFFTLLGTRCARGGGGGAPKGLVHNLPMQFSTLHSMDVASTTPAHLTEQPKLSKLETSPIRPFALDFEGVTGPDEHKTPPGPAPPWCRVVGWMTVI